MHVLRLENLRNFLPSKDSIVVLTLALSHNFINLEENLKNYKIWTGTEQSPALMSTKIAFIFVLWGMTRSLSRDFYIDLRISSKDWHFRISYRV